MNIYDINLEDLIDYIKEIGEPSYRAGQIYKWLYSGAENFEDMKNISKALRQKLSKDYYIFIPKIETKLVSKIDGTVKYLFRMKDNAAIEGVVMKYKHGLTMCVSSQAGCRMGCAFCASTLYGLERNLTSGEILGQILAAQRDLGERISNVVMMGSGEPFDNIDNVFKFLKNVTNNDGLNIGARHITISTCGILKGIKMLSDIGSQVNLSISLHAPTDEIRQNIMPIAKSVKIKELIDECREYFRKTKRRVTFEYALIKDVNDGKENALKLCDLLKGFDDFHVNLIPVNNVSERDFKKNKKEEIIEFANILEKNGIKVTVRREMGSDINAACGQLRNQNRE